jgi:hypothetical protein
VVKRSALISPDYAAQLRQMHAARAFSHGGQKHAGEILQLAAKVGAQTVLDYGSGPGNLVIGTLPVSSYDPAVPGRDEDPEPADLIVCTDVLEHIEPEKLDAVLRHMRGLMLKAAYVVIALRPADKRLPDGRNAHLLIDNGAWWLDRLRKEGWLVKRHAYTGDELIVWLRKKE